MYTIYVCLFIQYYLCFLSLCCLQWMSRSLCELAILQSHVSREITSRTATTKRISEQWAVRVWEKKKCQYNLIPLQLSLQTKSLRIAKNQVASSGPNSHTARFLWALSSDKNKFWNSARKNDASKTIPNQQKISRI